MINYNKFIYLLFIMSLSLYGNTCNLVTDPINDKEWVVSNMCHFENTMIVNVDEGQLIGKYNPFTYLRKTGNYEYKIEIIEVLDGEIDKNIDCLKYNLEKVRPTTTFLTGKRIISFTEHDEQCIFPDISIYPIADYELIRFSKKLSTNLEK